MHAASAKRVSETLASNQRAALISLLADDDPGIYQTIRHKLLSFGQLARQWLHPYTLSNDPVLRRRATEIIRYLARQDQDKSLLAFCLSQGEHLDLERGCLLLAQTQYPDSNPAAYQALLDSWAADLADHLDFAAPAEETLRALSRYLFTRLGFAGSPQHLIEPDTSYLNRVIDARRGNPVSLCILYLLLARRLHFPMAPFALAGALLCRHQSTTRETYVDVAQGGKLLGKAECLRRSPASGGGPLRPRSLHSLSHRRLFGRLCLHLHQSYAHLEMTEQARRVRRYLVALNR